MLLYCYQNDVVYLVRGENMNKLFINPTKFTKTIGAYSHGVKVNIGDSNIIFITGQIAMDSSGNAIAPGNYKKQTEYIFENIKNILEESGSTLNDIVKVQIFVTDMDQYSKVSEIRNMYLKDAKPATTLVEINSTVKNGCDVEIEAIAISQE